MAVYFLTTKTRACAYYRCELPARALAEVGVRSVTEPGVDVDPIDFMPKGHENFPVWVFQIPHGKGMPGLARRLKAAGKVLIVEFDDNYFSLPTDNPQILGDTLNPEVIEIRKEVASLADMVTVSTPELIEVYRPYCDNVVWLPNCIDLDDFPEPKDKGERIIVGWAGAIGDDNTRTFASNMAQLVHDFDHVDLAIGGDKRVFDKIIVPPERKRYLGICSVEEFPEMINNFDIAVIPLAKNTFNDGKSELKGLQYGALKIPFLASDVAPYRRFCEIAQDDRFLIKKEKHWLPRLKELIADRALQQELGLVVHDVATRRQIKYHIGEWIEAYSSCVPE